MDIEYINPEMPYLDVVARQETAVADILQNNGPERLFFCEHTPVYTLGSSAKESDVLGKSDIPVVKTGRGGQVTYHGPGQRVVYPILDLRKRERDIRAYIRQLQKCLTETLAELGIHAYCRDEIGVWVDTDRGPEKIAAIGVRVRKWITFHGIALNVNPNLDHFKGIVPCGISDMGVTSLKKLGVNVTMEEVDKVLIKNFEKTFSTS